RMNLPSCRRRSSADKHEAPSSTSPPARLSGFQEQRRKKTTNLAQGPSFTGFCLLETHLRGLDSRSRIRDRLSRNKTPRNRAVSPEPLGASRLPSDTAGEFRWSGQSPGFPFPEGLIWPRFRPIDRCREFASSITLDDLGPPTDTGSP